MSDASPIDGLTLVAAEDRHSRADWERSAAAVLRKAGRLPDDAADADVWDALARTTLDGIAVTPLGLPGEPPTGPRPHRAGAWDNRPLLEVDDPATGNDVALGDLGTGATSLWLQLVEGVDLALLLDGVLLDLAPVVLDAPHDPVGVARSFLEVLRERGTTPAAGTNLGADPIGVAVRAGRQAEGASRGSEQTASELVDVARLARGAGVLGVVVDGTVVHDLGASEAQEIGYVLAVGASYLRALTGAGLSVEAALGVIEVRLAATDEQFPTIAKLRAARRTWARLAELSGAAPEARLQRQHAVTSRPMMTRYDPWVNMLRTTVAAFAAGVGGAEAVTVLPFDSRLGVPDAFGRRIARNTSSLLVAESHVARVSDPAGGAWAVERLTDDLAEVGWAELGRIEEAGGVEAALADGSLRARVDDVVARRDAQIARRSRPLTGLSEFPHLGETLPQRAPHPVPSPVRPYGAAFEALRDEPATTPVFLATMGTLAQHTARATFAANLFAAGGVSVESAGVTTGPTDVVAAYAGQPVACLAGSDATYDEWGTDLVSALRSAGVRHVIVAGRPRDLAVDDSCAAGVDALAFLARTREELAR